MTDGPYKSLKMKKEWKELARKAETEAHSLDEIRESLEAALKKDWRDEIPREFEKEIEEVFICPRTLFGEDNIDLLESHRAKAAEYSLSNSLLDSSIQVLAEGQVGRQAWAEAMQMTLLDRCMRGMRQIEEHYSRRCGREFVERVVKRVEGSIDLLRPRLLEGVLTDAGTGSVIGKLKRKDGLEDGVQLPEVAETA